MTTVRQTSSSNAALFLDQDYDLTYSIRVRCRTEVGWSAWSAPVEYLHHNPIVAPDAPENLAVSIGLNSLIVDWDVPAAGETPTEYEVIVTDGVTPVIQVVTAPTTTYTFTGLVDGTYNVSVVANNAGGSSEAATIIGYSYTALVPSGSPISFPFNDIDGWTQTGSAAYYSVQNTNARSGSAVNIIGDPRSYQGVCKTARSHGQLQHLP